MRTKKRLIFTLCLACLSVCVSVCAQTPAKQIPEDWFKKDPANDSIVGISLDAACKQLRGRAFRTVVVAVIDNGVDIEHEDLKNIIWTNKNEIAGNGIDDDHNGYTDDIHGWNFRGKKGGMVVENEHAASTQFYLAFRDKFERSDSSHMRRKYKETFGAYMKARKQYLEKQVSKDSGELLFTYNADYNTDLLIDNGDKKSTGYGSPLAKLTKNLNHGTHVAGIIGAQRDNQIGVEGVADHVLIMPLLATTALGDERDKDIARAIRYSVDNGAQIINMSFSKLFSPDKKQVDEAIRYAERKNVLVVHAAGNDGVDIDSVGNFHYPVGIYEDGGRARNFITVGWSRALFDFRLAHPHSGYGKLNVDLFAPGSDIFSTVPGNRYESKSGSSMSAAVVSGVAAILLSYFPQLSAKEVKSILIRSSFVIDQLVNKPGTQTKVPFNTLSVSGGIVNANNAVQIAIKDKK